MSDWNTLLKAALIGSDKPWSWGPMDPASSDASVPNFLREVHAQQAPSNTPGGLLRLAGVMSVCRRAGWVPPATGLQPVKPADPESRASANEAWAGVLSQALSSGPQRLLHQVVFAMGQAGLLAPAHRLPALLNAGRQNTGLRAHLMPVLGERGRWLASHHPDWAYARGVQDQADPRTLWDHGSLEQRCMFLRAERASQPSIARDRLQADWGQLAAKDRAALIATLHEGLCQEDEAFLAAQLKDRAQEVRRIAADLLAVLPASAYSQRMVERAQALVREVPAESGVLERLWSRMGVRPASSGWTVQAPEAVDANWKPDQLETDRPRYESLGERAWWLYQLASRTPLRWWAERTGFSPSECVTWALASDWSDALLRAWRHAIQWQPDPAWAQALLEHSPSISSQERLSLLASLSPEQRERYHLEQVNASTDVSQVALSCLEACASHAHLGRSVSARVAQQLRHAIDQGALLNNYLLRSQCVELACCLHPQELSPLCSLPRHAEETTSLSEALGLLEQVVRSRQQLFHLTHTPSTS